MTWYRRTTSPSDTWFLSPPPPGLASTVWKAASVNRLMKTQKWQLKPSIKKDCRRWGSTRASSCDRRGQRVAHFSGTYSVWRMSLILSSWTLMAGQHRPLRNTCDNRKYVVSVQTCPWRWWRRTSFLPLTVTAETSDVTTLLKLSVSWTVFRIIACLVRGCYPNLSHSYNNGIHLYSEIIYCKRTDENSLNTKRIYTLTHERMLVKQMQNQHQL